VTSATILRLGLRVERAPTRMPPGTLMHVEAGRLAALQDDQIMNAV
jgi:hypothetical protein